MLSRSTSISSNLLLFCRFLRKNGFDTALDVEEDLLKVVSLNRLIEDPQLFRLGIKSVLCKSPQQIHRFESLYERFWRELDQALDSKLKQDTDVEPEILTLDELKKQPPSFQAIKEWLFGGQNEEETHIASYSPLTHDAIADLRDVSPGELDEIIKIVELMARAMRMQLSKRFIASTTKRKSIDIRRSLRENLPRYQEIVSLKYRQLKEKETSIILLADASKSMQLFSQLIIQFMFGIRSIFRRQHVFAFATDLMPLATHGQDDDLGAFLRKLEQSGATWQSGTRIGHSFKQFNDRYGHKLMGRKNTVIILSDGWDTGEPDLLRKSMRQIHRRSKRVIWLNPLAVSEAWSPQTMGMKAALPYIDLFIPGYNLAALRQLAQSLLMKRTRSTRI